MLASGSHRKLRTQFTLIILEKLLDHALFLKFTGPYRIGIPQHTWRELNGKGISPLDYPDSGLVIHNKTCRPEAPILIPLIMTCRMQIESSYAACSCKVTASRYGITLDNLLIELL